MLIPSAPPYEGYRDETGRQQVYLTIALMVIATVLYVGMVLVPHMGEVRPDISRAPDVPMPFGYNMAWLAVRTDDRARLCRLLGLKRTHRTNWQSGITAIYDNRYAESHVFVTPTVSGWTFVVGLALPHPVGRRFADKCLPLVQQLGRHFEEVQYYFSYPPIGFFAWLRIAEGRLLRAYAVGDEGVLWNKGRAIKAEPVLPARKIKKKVPETRPEPCEADVIRLAGMWGLDPTKLDERDLPPALGWIAPVPEAWRPERLRTAPAGFSPARA